MSRYRVALRDKEPDFSPKDDYGKPTPLKIIKYSTRFDEQKKDFKHTWAVIHDNRILCQGIREYPYMIFYPIEWNNYTACKSWVDKGCIADIQESFQNLAICFRKEIILRVDI